MVSRCEICGRNEALYVCRNCSRRVCEECFNPETWLCRECLASLQSVAEAEPAPTSLSLLPKLMFLGFLLIVVGMLLMAFSAFTLPPGGNPKGFIFILSFPFFFGFGYGSEAIPVAPVFASVFLALVLAGFILLIYHFLKP